MSQLTFKELLTVLMSAAGASDEIIHPLSKKIYRKTKSLHTFSLALRSKEGFDFLPEDLHKRLLKTHDAALYFEKYRTQTHISTFRPETPPGYDLPTHPCWRLVTFDEEGYLCDDTPLPVYADPQENCREIIKKCLSDQAQQVFLFPCNSADEKLLKNLKNSCALMGIHLLTAHP